eukprot:gene14127-biopygen12617
MAILQGSRVAAPPPGAPLEKKSSALSVQISQHILKNLKMHQTFGGHRCCEIVLGFERGGLFAQGLCCAGMCYAVLCWDVLCSAVPCSSAVLCNTVLRCAAQQHCSKRRREGPPVEKDVLFLTVVLFPPGS